MKPPKAEKLRLNRETLRVRSDAQAHPVEGGLRVPFGCVAAGCLLVLFLAFSFRVEAQTNRDLSDAAGSQPSFPIAGNPPLTLAMVNKATDFFERLLDAKFTAEQRRQFQDSLIASWKARRVIDMQSTVNVIQLCDQLNQKTAQEREMYLQALRAGFVAQMRAQPNNVVSRWMLHVYDSAHKPLAAGNPPLTQQVADAYAEMFDFMLRESMGKQYFAAGRDFKAALAQDLIARYNQLAPAQQAALSQSPALWVALQAQWPVTPENQRQKLREQWRSTFTSLGQSAVQQAGAGNGQNQSSPSSVDQLANKEVQQSWVRQLSQSYMTQTNNIIMNRMPFR